MFFDVGKGNAMQSMSAKDAKYGFGRLIDLARAEPVLVAKHGRPVVVVMSVEEYERLKGSEVGGGIRKLSKSKTAHPTGVEEN
jgi:prevent-host-death family protein